MILPVVLYGASVLREVAKPIEPDYPELPQLIENMFETMYHAEGVGLAAPQIGRAIRLFIIDVSPIDAEDFPELKNYPPKKVFINAEIVERSGEIVEMDEGCLSLPKLSERVPRHSKIRIKYLDENLQPQDEEFEGYYARVIQHEYDHIEGKVFTDNISPLRKQLVKSKLQNIAKRKVICHYKTK